MFRNEACIINNQIENYAPLRDQMEDKGEKSKLAGSG